MPAVLNAARGALRSPALRSAALLAAGGGGFALGNLLLARVLPVREYGVVALLLSLIQVGAALGSLGLPTLVNRHALRATGQLLRYSLWLAALAGLASAAVALFFYRLPTVIASILAIAVAAAALGRIPAAVLQSRQRFGASLLLTQVHNWLLLASVPLLLVTDQRSATAVLLFILLCYLITTCLGWTAARDQDSTAGSLTPRMLWSEGLSAAGFGLAFNLFLQLDRIVIGDVLSLEDLAAYSLVASIAGSPFRMLQISAGHTLVPQLRAAANRNAALALLRRESLLMIGMSALAAPALFVLTPWLIRWIAGSATDAGYVLAAAVIVVGFVRLWQGLASAVVNAVGTARELVILSTLGWGAIAIAVALANMTSSHGLGAVVYSLGAGWCVVAIGATTLACKALARLQPE